MSAEGKGATDNGRRQFLIGIGVVAGGTAAGMALRPWLVGAADVNPPIFNPTPSFGSARMTPSR